MTNCLFMMNALTIAPKTNNNNIDSSAYMIESYA